MIVICVLLNKESDEYDKDVINKIVDKVNEREYLFIRGRYSTNFMSATWYIVYTMELSTGDYYEETWRYDYYFGGPSFKKSRRLDSSQAEALGLSVYDKTIELSSG